MISFSDKKKPGGKTDHPGLSPTKPGRGDPFFKSIDHKNTFFGGGSNSGGIQRSKNNSLPQALQANLESSFNQDFSGVDIQKDSQRAFELNALAFTAGESIHFAPGQFDPGSTKGRELIGHEFSHVVQQRSGVVMPTNIMGKGLSVNDDKGLEEEATVLGKKAVAGETISTNRSVGLSIRNALIETPQASRNILQFAKHPSHYGDWFDDTYALTSSGTRRGVDMKMRFKPTANVDAELIGLTQSIQSMHQGTPFYLNSDPFYLGRAITSANAITNPSTGFTDEGTQIDRLKDKISPVYAAENTTGAGISATNLQNPAMGGNGQYGYRYKAGATLNTQDAKLTDGPAIGSVDVSKNSTQVFETSALALKGVQAGTYYGSVQWGWKTDAAGAHTKLPFKIISQGVPSSTFMKAAQVWNSSKSSAGKDTIDLPIVDVKIISNVAGVNIGLGPMFTHLPFGTRVQAVPVFISMVDTIIRVMDGPFIGEIGTVHTSDLSDERP